MLRRLRRPHAAGRDALAACRRYGSARSHLAIFEPANRLILDRHPLFQMLLYIFLFAMVFKQRIGGTQESPRDYTVYILSGLIAWLSIVPVLTATCVSITSNANLVKQFNFELEILPIKEVISGMVFWFVGVSRMIAYTIVVYRELPWTYVLLPVVFAIHLVMMIGISWGLSAITVYFRDLKDVVAVAATLGVYLLPVVYLPTWVPRIFEPLIYVVSFQLSDLGLSRRALRRSN